MESSSFFRSTTEEVCSSDIDSFVPDDIAWRIASDIDIPAFLLMYMRRPHSSKSSLAATITVSGLSCADSPVKTFTDEPPYHVRHGRLACAYASYDAVARLLRDDDVKYLRVVREPSVPVHLAILLIRSAILVWM